MKFKGRGIVLPIALMAYSQSLMANPTGGNVAAGTASINQDNPKHTIITQTTPKAIINWESFDIAPGQITQFKQPDPTSTLLNRIQSNTPSRIFGTIEANGNVVLLNPNGIHFGNGSRIQVAGLFAFTANITDQEFMRDHPIGEGYPFRQDPQKNAGIINEGHITVKDSGMVALVAPGVKNTGIIEGNLSSIEIGSGQVFTVNFDGQDLIHFATAMPAKNRSPVGPNGEVLKSAVELDKKGEIKGHAVKVRVKVSDAERIVKNVINMDGIINADSAIRDRNGEIHLISQNTQNGSIEISGKMSAKGTGSENKGGNILISGNQVGLFDKAELDVSGKKGGGNIFVGGDKKGSRVPNEIFSTKTPIANANITRIAQDVQMKANALESGHGGKIIVWSDKDTQFFGNISAYQTLGHSGGFVEVSGHNLQAAGKIDAGLGGEVLFDPFDVIIANEASGGGTFSGGNPTIWTPNAMGSYVSVATLQNILNSGTSATITTTGAGAQAGDIRVASIISKTAGGPATLTLKADNNINIPVTIQAIPTDLTLNLEAPNGTATISGNFTRIHVASASITANDLQNLTFDPNSFATQSLSLNVATCTMFGSVGGVTDPTILKDPRNTPHIRDGNPANPYPIPPSDPPTLVNYFGPQGSHLFNGFKPENDLFFTLTGPLPTPTPTPIPLPTPTPPLIPTITPNQSIPPPTPPGTSSGSPSLPPLTPENPLVGGSDPTSGSSPSASSGAGSTAHSGSASGSGSPSGSNTSPASNAVSGSDTPAHSNTIAKPGFASDADSPSSGGQPTAHASGNVPIGGDSGPGQEIAPKSNVGSETRPANPEMSSGVSDLKGEPVSKSTCSKQDRDPQGPSCVAGVNSSEAPVDKTLQKNHSVSPIGIAGTDVPMGAAGIGGSKEGQEMKTSLQAEGEAGMRGLLRHGIVDTLQKAHFIHTGVSGYTPEILPAEAQFMQELEADRRNLTHRNKILAPIP